jgi:hypothetical protein
VLGETLDDPEAVDVRQGLVEETHLTEDIRLVDDGRDGGADPGGRWAQGGSSELEQNGSMKVYINMH